MFASSNLSSPTAWSRTSVTGATDALEAAGFPARASRGVSTSSFSSRILSKCPRGFIFLGLESCVSVEPGGELKVSLRQVVEVCLFLRVSFNHCVCKVYEAVEHSLRGSCPIGGDRKSVV